MAAIQAPQFFTINEFGAEVILNLGGNILNGAGLTFSVSLVTPAALQGTATASTGTVGYPVG